MSPLDFLSWFRRELHEANISFALTSGQACVYYGLQQSTKDSDWIVAPKDIDRLAMLLVQLDSREGFKVCFRPICGAPLTSDFLAEGWTNHISIQSDGVEHHLDFFGKPPRVRKILRDSSDNDYADRLTVAAMKQTDREKDWPFVFALAKQAWKEGDINAILYVLDEHELKSLWSQVSDDMQRSLCTVRPLLNWIQASPSKLKRGLLIERYVWQQVNRGRYQRFQSAWNDFFRQWRKEPEFSWPPLASFASQRSMLLDAANRYGLPTIVITRELRLTIIQNACDEASEVFQAREEEIGSLLPPAEVLLP